MNALVWILQEVNAFLVRSVAWIVAVSCLTILAICVTLIWWAPTPSRWINRLIGQAQAERKGKEPRVETKVGARSSAKLREGG